MEIKEGQDWSYLQSDSPKGAKYYEFGVFDKNGIVTKRIVWCRSNFVFKRLLTLLNNHAKALNSGYSYYPINEVE